MSSGLLCIVTDKAVAVTTAIKNTITRLAYSEIYTAFDISENNYMLLINSLQSKWSTHLCSNGTTLDISWLKNHVTQFDRFWVFNCTILRKFPIFFHKSRSLTYKLWVQTRLHFFINILVYFCNSTHRKG